MAINCNSTHENKKALLNSLNNETIRFGTYIPHDSQFVSLGRKIKITDPAAAVKIANYGKEIVPDLIALLNDEERDWAAHVILSSILGGDAALLSVYANDYKKWQKEQKVYDIKKWKE